MRETDSALFTSATLNFMSISTDCYRSLLKSISSNSTSFLPHFFPSSAPRRLPCGPGSLNPSPSRQQMLRLWPDVLSLMLPNHVFPKFSYGKHLQRRLLSSANTLTWRKVRQRQKKKRCCSEHLHHDLTVAAANRLTMPLLTQVA